MTEPPVEVIPPDSPEAVRVAAIMRPASYAAVRDPLGLDALDLSALELPELEPLPPFDWP